MGGVTPPRPLSEKDDRSNFDCGRATLNHWFQRNARRNQVADISRTYVICDPADDGIAGFVSLSAGQIEREFLPKPDRRNRPNSLPVVLLGQLAIDQNFQGHGYAVDLLRFALIASVGVSDSIGSFAVITHPLDDAVREFYRKYGFDDLQQDPQNAMIIRMKTLRALVSEG